MFNSILGKIKRLNSEDLIWYVYFFIIVANLYSNSLERENISLRDIGVFNKIKNLDITVLTIAFLIYLYFTITNYQNLQEYQHQLNDEKVLLKELSLIASILFLVGGAILLYTAFKRDPEDEIAI